MTERRDINEDSTRPTKFLTIDITRVIDKCTVIQLKDIPVVDLNQDQPKDAARPSLRTLANRRNALKSTGPKTVAGKRRPALNSRKQLYPKDLEREFRARGEDPRDFRRLHRDLVAIFQPQTAPDQGAVELMARTWWEKARRIREWVAAGPAPCDAQDRLIDTLLLFLVSIQRNQHQPWRVRLASVLGQPIGSPAVVRCKIEARLHLFGAKRSRRKYPRHPREDARPSEFVMDEIGEIFAQILGRWTARTQSAENGPMPNSGEESETKPNEANGASPTRTMF